MANTIVTASLVVELGSDDAETSVLTAEIDTAVDGLNSGNTSFSAGDQVGYLVYRTDDVQLIAHIATAGSIVSAGYRDIEVEEFIVFSNTQSVSLPYPVQSGWETPVWYGTTLGNISVANQSQARVSPLDPNNPPDYYVGVAKVKYVTRAYQYKLHTPAQVNGEDIFQILVFLAGEVQ